MKDLIDRLEKSVHIAIENEERLDSRSWAMEHGVLITVNEAKMLVDRLKPCLLTNDQVMNNIADSIMILLERDFDIEQYKEWQKFKKSQKN
ncbi:MAG: hypothetical protein KA234_00310 [Saprospiraceae bacterium]|nr:hypothetical protein [Saprospiraceae bacterium]